MALRGLEAKHEQDPSRLIRDTRTLGQRFYDFFKEPRNAAMVTLTAMISCFFFKAFADLIFLMSIGVFFYSYSRRTTLPFRMPKRSNQRDFNDVLPGGKGKAKMAGGITYLGNQKSNNDEVWFTNEDMRTHILMFGSTGSGKTEALLSLSFNSLVQGSGFIFVDGKGDNSVFSKIFSMARSMGREDDVLLVNFMTGARDIVGPQKHRLSNTLNPFCRGSSSMLAQLVVSLMDSSSASPDGDMWKGRAIGFVEALMRLLVYMRDQGKILLDANILRKYFALDRLEAVHVDRMFVRDDQEPVSLKDAPDSVVEPIDNYMVNLPGYNRAKKGKQVSQVLEQHGFITMQLTRVFTSLADTYGHILRTNLAEVDLHDVVLNRRILVVLLPALEKSPPELANLGKIIIATLKAMMASGLGEGVEGSYKDLIARKPTNSPTPFVCILDEYGYYSVEGFAIVAAQARSLGFCAVFASQDLPSLQKASKEEAASIGGNTNIKVAMKIEDPVETWEFIQKTAGEAFVTKVDAFQTDPQSMFNTYLDTRSSSAERRARVDLLDLKEQLQGEAHIFFGSTMIRSRMFYANPAPVQFMRLNQHLKVDRPKMRVLLDLQNRLHRFDKLREEGKLEVEGAASRSSDVDFVIQTYHETDEGSLIDRGINALIGYSDSSSGALKSTVDETAIAKEQASIEESATELNVFNKVTLSDLTRLMVPESEFADFSAPLSSRIALESPVAFAERLMGKSAEQGRDIATELIHDMEKATEYPPQTLEQPTSVDRVVQLLNELSSAIEKMVASEEEKKK
ncbi:MAG: TraM recognition domain-containing protein [Gammaproteobacteria bacterium]|nr:TraM recognition domain-containing protein [Gammaproteobacteria bacterium]